MNHLSTLLALTIVFSSLGYEYEFRLSQCLQKHSITCVGEFGVHVVCKGRGCGHDCTCYSLHIGEKQLREQECDKTPDCKLEIPIGELLEWIGGTHASLSCCNLTNIVVSNFFEFAPHLPVLESDLFCMYFTCKALPPTVLRHIFVGE